MTREEWREQWEKCYGCNRINCPNQLHLMACDVCGAPRRLPAPAKPKPQYSGPAYALYTNGWRMFCDCLACGHVNVYTLDPTPVGVHTKVYCQKCHDFLFEADYQAKGQP